MSLPDPSFKDQLVLFHELVRDPVIAAFFQMLEHHEEAELSGFYKAAARFARKLYEKETVDWSEYLLHQVETCPGPLNAFALEKRSVPRPMLDALFTELDFLQQCAGVEPDQLSPVLSARWTTRPVELKEAYLHRLVNQHLYGYRPYSEFAMFRTERRKEKARLHPIHHSDPIRLEDLWGYEDEHKRIIDNTKAFLQGKPANNILLYGPAGTGKSATIKAVVNEFQPEGLRLLEVDKDHLDLLPQILDEVRKNPLHFIIFIDDLSFQPDDDRYALLKAVLEGSGSAQTDNVLIYATSNRRHVVKESMEERNADVHLSDHLQEMSSLSDRFGLRIFFEKPDRKQYLELVRFYLDREGIELDEKELELQAERFALGKGTRSARSARQLARKIIVEREGESHVIS